MNANSLPANDSASQSSSAPVSLEEAKHAMIKRARQMVNQLVKHRGIEEPPFLAEELAHLQGIKEIVKTDLGELSALLLRMPDGYVMKVNASHPKVRQNFSCAHEIGHTFLHDLEQQSSRGNAEFRLLVSDIHEQAKERLCDVAATELLMPELVFRKYLSGFGLCVNSVERLADTFKVSIPAAAIRIAEVSPEPCMAIQWKRWQKNKSKGFLQVWKNKKEHTYVRDPSSLLKAYQGDSAVKSFRVFELGNTRKRCYMESKGFGRDKTRYVISLVFPDR